MNHTSELHQQRRDFAVAIVKKLRDAGYQALWAGGCVRDQLLGLQPKDYDVATDAPPARVRDIFGHGRTIAIGAAFGVISVIGPSSIGNVEIATFRQDAQYGDGRHPDSVVFSTPEHDAQRRDFTINGLFYDPLESRVLDYVGGQLDLENKVLRAIGDPRHRFAEDKLRMLRAVRFTITYDLAMDPETFAAIQQHARELVVVSAERVADEMRRMLLSARRAVAVQMLYNAGLLEVVLPEVAKLFPDGSRANERDSGWGRTLAFLGQIAEPTFSVCLAALLRELQSPDYSIVDVVTARWRLSRHDAIGASWLQHHEWSIRTARQLRWPVLQSLLVHDRVEELLQFAGAVASVLDGHQDDLNYCRDKLRLPPHELNPRPLLNGDDLLRLGVERGPFYRTLLSAVRDAQLEKLIRNQDEAVRLVIELVRENLDKQKPTP